MKIWIVNPYGTLPGEGWRDYRSWMIAQAAERAGHEVVWWISSFEHRSKRYREQRPGVVHRLTDAVSFILVPATSYTDHMSVARIRSEQSFAREFEGLSRGLEKPDVIILADPALFFGAAVQRVRRACACALVVDVLDLWPELFRLALPGVLRRWHRLIFWPLYRRRRRLLHDADGVVAVSADYAKVVSREGRPDCHVAYLGVDVSAFAAKSVSACHVLDGWVKSEHEIWAIYAGTLGVGYDLPTLIAAIKELVSHELPLRFLIAGEGPLRGEVEKLVQSFPDKVKYLGQVSPEMLVDIYRYCDVGLCSYAADSTVSMPVKLYDYLAAGLAVVSSLDAEAGEILTRDNVGVRHAAESPTAMANALKTLVNDRDLLLVKQENARKLARQFDSPCQHDGLLDYVVDITKKSLRNNNSA